MALTNLLGEREALAKNSEIYGDKVQEYMEAMGYYITETSPTHGGLVDQKYELPEIRGDREVWVELKWTDQRRHGKKFLEEMGKYFLHYMDRSPEKRFDVAIFGRNLENFKEWRKIFDVTKQTDEAIQEFYDRVCENDKLSDDHRRKIKSYSMDDFEEFLSDTHVYQADYDSLLMKIEEFEKDDRFKPDFFQREAEPITDRSELTTNLVEITEYPENLYIGDQVEGATQEVAFKLRPFTVPTWFKSNKVYSLLPPEEMPRAVKQFIDPDTVEETGFRSWVEADQGNADIGKRLIRAVVLSKGEDRGCIAINYRSDYHLYFPHEDPEAEVRKEEGRQVTKHYDEAESPFFRHHSLRIGILEYSGQYFLTLKPAILFTTNGKENRITGEQAKPLHDRFSPSRHGNNRKTRSRINHWWKILDYGDPKQDNLDIGTEPVMLEVNKRPPKDTDERDGTMQNKWIGDFQ
ncbi:hypothetical protein [Natrinema sp. 1APR25-10V2]|uniref:hypothetical protein n=1 Tax=Natrinema sp. 1APR25-10V2 TaxID=2951081 RepID=UPI002876FF18|nr:hypothetical protein [Natrinema sp. 1APR25-10V2]MDS0478314.1 hypothetical protein [Natrinema sp. 1APR25-10V2]